MSFFVFIVLVAGCVAAYLYGVKVGVREGSKRGRQAAMARLVEMGALDPSDIA